MKHVWTDAMNLGVSNEVFMVEVEVIQRLVLDQAISLQGLDLAHVARGLRRSSVFKYQFAQTVGKRMLTERLISRGRTSIIEHHRSVNWGEREYKAMYLLAVQKSGSKIPLIVPRISPYVWLIVTTVVQKSGSKIPLIVPRISPYM
jgi:hypothetical protein